MTTVHDCVKDTMINYNSAFDTRWRVLHHVFFVIGTGYFWSGEAIYNNASDSKRRWTKERKAPLSVNDFIASFDNHVAWIKKTPCLTVKDDSIIALQRKFHAFHASFLIENMDVIVDNNITITDAQMPKNADMNGGNSLFWHPPEQMAVDWRAALVEAGTIMLELVKNHYANGDDSDNATWSCDKTKKVYFQMKEHVELVRTNQYKRAKPSKKR